MAVTVFPNMELNCASIVGNDANSLLDHEIHSSLVQQLSNSSQQLNGSNSGSSGRSTPNNAGEPAPGKLFVGGLSWQTSSDKLREYFSMFGSVTDVLIMKDPVTARSRGFGFITFSDPTSVDKVLKVPIHTLDGKKIDPKHATPKNRPKPSNKTKKIFVGGVSQDTSSDEVKTYFNQFGKVEETVMLMDQQTKRHRGFGFVTFENEDVVDRVCEIHFHTIKNKKVECKKAQPKEAVQANAQLLGKRIILGSLGMRMAGGTPATAGSIAAAAAAAAASNPLAMVQAHQVHAQAAAAAAAAAQAQSAAATVAGYSKLFGAAAAAAAYPGLGGYHHRYAPYPLAGVAGAQQAGGSGAPGSGGAPPAQSVGAAGTNPYQGYSLTNVDMTSFQGVDWGAMYGMAGMYV